MNAITTQTGTNAIAAVLQHNDLSKLSIQQKNDYYMGVCNSLGMNPMTRPFEFIKLGGREVLYAKRDAADQLRKINAISIEVVSREVENDMLTVHVRAKDESGRVDEDFGVVSIAGLKGENLANAILKGVTKAKRRVTLSISGLGFLDETEVSDVIAAQPSEAISETKKEPTEEEAEAMRLADEAKKYFGEIELCDTSEKLEIVVKRYAMTMAKLSIYLPKWHAKLVEILTGKRAAFQQPMERDELAEALGDAEMAAE